MSSSGCQSIKLWGIPSDESGVVSGGDSAVCTGPGSTNVGLEKTTTDSAVSGCYKDFTSSRAERTVEFTEIQKDDVADLTDNDPQTCLITFKTGVTVTGSLRIENSNPQLSVEDSTKTSYSGSYQGAVTTNGLDDYANATDKMILIVAKDNKTYLGTGMGSSLTISANIDSETTFSQEFKIDGALSETVGS